MALKLYAGLMLDAQQAMFIAWGEELTFLYNDKYAPILGAKHPHALGLPFADVWSDIWEQIKPLVDSTMAGEASWHEDLLIPMRRNGYLEDAWFSFSYTPIRDENGRVAGMLCAATETTGKVLAQRQQLGERERLRQMFEQAPGLMALLREPSHTFELVNPAYQELMAGKDLIGKPVREALPELEGQGFFELLDNVYATGEPFIGEAVPVRMKGPQSGRMEERYFDFVYQPIKGTDGKTTGIFVEGFDVTEARASVEALKEESYALEVLNATAAKVAGYLDIDTLVQGVVDAGVELTGAQFGAFFYNRVDASGESYTLYTLSGAPAEAFSSYPLPRNTHVFAPTFNGEGVVRSDDILQDLRYGRNAPHKGMPEGHLPVRSYLAVPVRSRSGDVIGGLFFGHAETGVFTERAERLTVGLAAQAATAMDNAQLFEKAQHLNQTLEVQVAERTADRDRMWRLSTDIMLVARFDGSITAVNPAWMTVIGWREDELIGSNFFDLVHPEDLASTHAEAGRLAQGLTTLRFENRYRHKDGSYRWISWIAVPDDHFVHAVGRDVTNEKQAAEELRQAEDALHQVQKMETVGQLTGGVAHDFNNLLQVVTGNLDMLIRRLPEDELRLRRSAENAMAGAKRAATLTQRLLAFSRRQPLAPTPIQPNKLVAGMSELLHRTLGEIIELETVLASGLWRVEADANQLENAILNLAVNARDAMLDGGKLTIETANSHIDRLYAVKNAEVAPGQYVLISVSDTGTGMDEDTLQRVFEPFFTTKEVGKGTGLGLSMVYGFVKQSGGHVKVYSELGHGTTVKIYLPRLVGEEPDEEASQAQAIPDGEGTETILVCEDDPEVRSFSVEMLQELGYRVLDAADGPAALRIFEQQPDAVDLLFTDVVLPHGMTGAVLVEQARSIRPTLKVLFTTGYARNAIVHHGRLDAGVELITKPFSYAELAARVREILDRP
jgi:PAS domain S-box-containing protein